MNQNALQLLILDDKTLMVDALSKYLKDRFGERIAISAFFDTDKCIRSIEERSQVIILEYFINAEDKKKDGLQILNQVKAENKKTEVTILSSTKELALAIEDIKKSACDYILKHQQSPYTLLKQIDKNILTPLKTIVGLPKRNKTTLPHSSGE
jgi:DNA-binding NtrC family response regulator